MATTQIERLTEALRAAVEAAEAAAPGDDGGSVNLDCAFLRGRTGLTNAAVKKAAAAAGVSVSRRDSRWWRGWMVHVGRGQGAMNTRMAEAAASALYGHGFDAVVYYKVD